MSGGDDMDLQTNVLHERGLNAHAATDQELSLALEVAQLRRIIAHGTCHHDIATLRNVQEQKNRVVEAAERYADDPSMTAGLTSAVRELRRITAAALPTSGESCAN